MAKVGDKASRAIMAAVMFGTFTGILLLSVYRQQIAELKSSAESKELQKLRKDLDK